jgi:hypothetical protein
VSTHTAKPSAYTRANPSVIPNFKRNDTSGDTPSAKHGAIPNVKYSDNPTTTSNIGNSGKPSVN